VGTVRRRREHPALGPHHCPTKALVPGESCKLRVNEQYRITFLWEQKGPYAEAVTCEDYH